MKIPITDEMRAQFQAELAAFNPSSDEILDNVRRVGPNKPLGYLKPSIIVECGENVEDIIEESERKGMVCKIIEKTFPPFVVGGQQFPGHNASRLFVWDEKALSSILQKNSEILRQNYWPETAQEFVYRVSQVNASIGSELFDLIADTFADYRNPGRGYTRIEESLNPPRQELDRRFMVPLIK